MKLGTWLAVVGTVGCVGLGFAAVMTSQGCTATLTAGSCDDGGCNFPSSSGSTSSSGGSEDAGPATQVDAGSTPPNPCLACEYGICSGLYTVCIADPGCLAIYQCTTACPSNDQLPDGGACIETCLGSAQGASYNLYVNLGACDLENECNGGPCAATCNPSPDTCNPQTGTADAGVDSGEDASVVTTPDAGAPDSSVVVTPDAGPADAGQTCTQCQATQCASQIAACAPTQPCGIYNQCVLGCTTATCPATCQTDNPSGYQAAQALGTCTTTNCPQCAQAQ